VLRFAAARQGYAATAGTDVFFNGQAMKDSTLLGSIANGPVKSLVCANSLGLVGQWNDKQR
jgi:hypothetical protein